MKKSHTVFTDKNMTKTETEVKYLYSLNELKNIIQSFLSTDGMLL